MLDLQNGPRQLPRLVNVIPAHDQRAQPLTEAGSGSVQEKEKALLAEKQSAADGREARSTAARNVEIVATASRKMQLKPRRSGTPLLSPPFGSRNGVGSTDRE